MKLICLFTTILLIITIGCERGKKMLTPIMDETSDVSQTTIDEISTQPSDEPLSLGVDFDDIVIPEKTIPESYVPVENDRLAHVLVLSGFNGITNEQLIFNTAEEALQNEIVQKHLEISKRQIKNLCETGVVSGNTSFSYFLKDRTERDKLIETYPAKFFIARNTDLVYIVNNEEVFYFLEIHINFDNACE